MEANCDNTYVLDVKSVKTKRFRAETGYRFVHVFYGIRRRLILAAEIGNERFYTADKQIWKHCDQYSTWELFAGDSMRYALKKQRFVRLVIGKRGYIRLERENAVITDEMIARVCLSEDKENIDFDEERR